MKVSVGRKQIEIIIDKEDEHFLFSHVLTVRENKSKYGLLQYVVCWPRGKCQSKVKTKSFHRLIMGAKKGDIVDHRNRRTLDNRKKNLRITDLNGNAQNRSPSKYFKGNKTSSKYKGVRKRGNTWVATIKYNKGKRIQIGTFKTEVLAAKAYDKKAKEFHGEFAVVNFKNRKKLIKRC